MSWVTTILPVATLVLGYFGTLLTESRRDGRALARSREERRALASAQRAEAREAFESESLRRLHTALTDYGRAVGRHHIADVLAARSVGEYGVAQVGDDVSESLRLATVAVRESAQLVLDDHTRDAALSALNAVGALALHRGPVEEAERLFGPAVAAIEAAQEAAAAGIRALYEPRE